MLICCWQGRCEAPGHVYGRRPEPARRGGWEAGGTCVCMVGEVEGDVPLWSIPRGNYEAELRSL